MGRTAIMIVALLAANLQCVAACSVLPCHEQPAHHPAPAQDCHHRAPAPSNDHHGKQDESGCGHQSFISEAVPYANPTFLDAALVATLPVVIQAQPELVVVDTTITDCSPPPRNDSASITILRL